MSTKISAYTLITWAIAIILHGAIIFIAAASLEGAPLSQVEGAITILIQAQLVIFLVSIGFIFFKTRAFTLKKRIVWMVIFASLQLVTWLSAIITLLGTLSP